MATSQRDGAKEASWREALGRFSSCGLSVREFCKREQLTESAFYAWRRTIGERDEAGGAGRQAPAFVPAVVTSEPQGESCIALELPGGGAHNVPLGFRNARLCPRGSLSSMTAANLGPTISLRMRYSR